MTFEFATAQRIVFGSGVSADAGKLVREFGTRAFVVTGRNPGRAQGLLETLRAQGIVAEAHATEHEPTVADIEAGVCRARAAECDVVVGFGGGSAIDAAKAISAMLSNPGEPADYLEVVGRARPLSRPSAPCLAFPTTAGTGAEVTRNAVLASPAHRVKVSLRSAWMLPRVACVDPALTYELPPALTATTGLDALTQLIEPYVCSRANPLTDGYCVEGMKRVARSLRAAVHDGRNTSAREDMALASLLGGLALANAGLGAVHGFAGPIGGAFPAPHGAVCGALLPGVVAMNVRALRARGPVEALLRYEDVARVLTGRPQATVEDAVAWLSGLVASFNLPRLSSYGLTIGDVPALVAAAAKASSMKANPVALTPDECGEILQTAL